MLIYTIITNSQQKLKSAGDNDCQYLFMIDTDVCMMFWIWESNVKQVISKLKYMKYEKYLYVIKTFLLIFSQYVTTTMCLKVVSATFLLVCFVCLKESTCEARKNVFYFTLKALFVLEIIKF